MDALAGESDSMPKSDPDRSADDVPPLDAELKDLEKRLGQLQPTPPGLGCIDIAMARKAAKSRGETVSDEAPRWVKFVPLGIAALVMTTGILLVGKLANSPTIHANIDVDFDDMIPVSMENSLRETESSDIVVVDGLGPMHPVMLHFETAQCWIDPETNTSVQVIQPWQELVFYPVATY